MNLAVVIPVILVLLALRWVKPGMLGWLATWWVGILVLLRFGFTVPVPVSVIKLYMGIVSGSLLAYVLSDAHRTEQVRRPLVAFLTERRYAVLLVVVALAIPSAVAASIYLDMTRPPRAPSFGRTVHPAPPEEITVQNQEYDLVTLDNPLRPLETSDPEAFADHLARGRETYYKNCFYCHGDYLQGAGMLAHGLNPLPTNFQDPGTIAMLQESFLFWRISKGAPGLPEEGGPWQSAMPAWESFLSEEEMWEVILFLYDFTGQRPRARHEVEK